MCKEILNVNCGVWQVYYEWNINGLRKTEKMSMTMLVLVVKIIEAVKKMILDNLRITIREVTDDV